MAGETVITVVGNLDRRPRAALHPLGCGRGELHGRVHAAHLRPADQRVEGRRSAVPACSVWRQAAENVAESLQRGMRVIVQGRLKQRSYETREGEKRTVFELEVDEVGPALRVRHRQGHPGLALGGGGGGGYSAVAAAAAATPAAAGGGPAAAAGARQTTRGRPPAPQGGGRSGGGAPANDPWGAPGVGSDEPPF